MAASPASATEPVCANLQLETTFGNALSSVPYQADAPLDLMIGIDANSEQALLPIYEDAGQTWIQIPLVPKGPLTLFPVTAADIDDPATYDTACMPVTFDVAPAAESQGGIPTLVRVLEHSVDTLAKIDPAFQPDAIFDAVEQIGADYRQLNQSDQNLLDRAIAETGLTAALVDQTAALADLLPDTAAGALEPDKINFRPQATQVQSNQLLQANFCPSSPAEFQNMMSMSEAAERFSAKDIQRNWFWANFFASFSAATAATSGSKKLAKVTADLNLAMFIYGQMNAIAEGMMPRRILEMKPTFDRTSLIGDDPDLTINLESFVVKTASKGFNGGKFITDMLLQSLSMSPRASGAWDRQLARSISGIANRIGAARQIVVKPLSPDTIVAAGELTRWARDQSLGVINNKVVPAQNILLVSPVICETDVLDDDIVQILTERTDAFAPFPFVQENGYTFRAVDFGTMNVSIGLIPEVELAKDSRGKPLTRLGDAGNLSLAGAQSLFGTGVIKRGFRVPPAEREPVVTQLSANEITFSLMPNTRSYDPGKILDFWADWESALPTTASWDVNTPHAVVAVSQSTDAATIQTAQTDKLTRLQISLTSNATTGLYETKPQSTTTITLFPASAITDEIDTTRPPEFDCDRVRALAGLEPDSLTDLNVWSDDSVLQDAFCFATGDNLDMDPTEIREFLALLTGAINEAHLAPQEVPQAWQTNSEAAIEAARARSETPAPQPSQPTSASPQPETNEPQEPSPGGGSGNAFSRPAVFCAAGGPCPRNLSAADAQKMLGLTREDAITRIKNNRVPKPYTPEQQAFVYSLTAP